ncbi:DUF2779 domain-containing protein [Aquabacterium sp. OR-4]|uniref:DUF2779 domain-containing protein n=1 Tax=Aquabacterium sp. OR-4 TaxID=2978127 RepID=UPI0028C60BE4|nr:DUF2779 domain-containing protein [Aquabacterium sp. OR-4]MDT7838779.1 DUF2779 domain-containing protein [Aquabacterium sp. OR-4]
MQASPDMAATSPASPATATTSATQQDWLDTDDLLRWRQCPRRYWWQREALAAGSAVAADALSADDGSSHALRPDDGPVGAAVGQALRASHPMGVEIVAPAGPHDAPGWALAVRATAAALDAGVLDAEGGAIVGACLASDDGVRVRADLLAPGERGLRVLRLRHATAGNEADVDAAALWAHVAARSGLRLQGVALRLVDTDFVYPGHGLYAGLYRDSDLSPMLGSRPVPAWLVAMRQCARGGLPAATPGAHCGGAAPCPWRPRCDAAPPEPEATAPDALAVLGRDHAQRLRAAGFARLGELSAAQAAAQLGEPRLQHIWQAVTQGAPVIAPALGAQLRAMPWPRRWLRIDTLGYAVPVWAGTRPYQALPFQWTLADESGPGTLLWHAYLAGAGAGTDPRRAWAESLLAAAAPVPFEAGPVFAYNAGYERNRLAELATLFDDLAPALLALQARLVDLYPLMRAHVYHPEMRGAWSFRAVARAFVPELGGHRFGADSPLPPLAASPAEAMARALHPGTSAPVREALRGALLAHGRRQVQVLMALTRRFEQAAP